MDSAYSEEQIALMFRLREGLVWHWHAEPRGDSVLHFLESEGLAEPHNSTH